MFVPLFVLVALLAVFAVGMNYFTVNTLARQKASLEKAVRADVTYCYATEGSYPTSLEYLEKKYGLTYDKDKFYVGYQSMGSNILPDITIVELEK